MAPAEQLARLAWIVRRRHGEPRRWHELTAAEQAREIGAAGAIHKLEKGLIAIAAKQVQVDPVPLVRQATAILEGGYYVDRVKAEEQR